MLELTENKSRIWFKIFNQDGTTLEGSNEIWHLPIGEKKGRILKFDGSNRMTPNSDGSWSANPSEVGVTWLISDPNRLYQLNSGQRIYIAQLITTPIHEEVGIIWVKETRLIREATGYDLKPFGIFRAFNHRV